MCVEGGRGGGGCCVTHARESSLLYVEYSYFVTTVAHVCVCVSSFPSSHNQEQILGSVQTGLAKAHPSMFPGYEVQATFCLTGACIYKSDASPPTHTRTHIHTHTRSNTH